MKNDKYFKTLLVVLFLILNGSFVFSQDWVQLGPDINNNLGPRRFGNSISLSNDGSRIAIGTSEISSGNGITAVAVYELDSGIWNQIGQEFRDEIGNVGVIGFSVSLSGDGSTVALSSPENDANGPNTGRVQIYRFNSATDLWEQEGNNIDGINDFEGLAFVSISDDGSIIAIGSIRNSGLVRIYQFISGDWVQIGLTINGDDPNDAAGLVSLSADGSRVAIGTTGTNNDYTRIYEFVSGDWIQLGTDINEDLGSAFLARIPISLSGDGNRIALGSPFNNDIAPLSGKVSVYEFISGDWVQIGANINGQEEGDRAGTSVSLDFDGSRVTFGAPRIGSSFPPLSYASVYEFELGEWTQVGTDILGEMPSNTASNELDFGSSISLSANGLTVAIGVPRFFNEMTGGTLPGTSGKVEVYEFESIICLAPKVFLQGALLGTIGSLMRDDLRTGGVLPVLSPYPNAPGFVNPNVFNTTGPNAIVDWVLIELRDVMDDTVVVASQAALLQRDGDVVGLVPGFGGILPPVTISVPEGDYFVVIQHRNHLGVRTASPISLSETCTSLDLTSDPNSVIGNTNAVIGVNGVFAMIAGDVNGDGQVQTIDVNTTFPLLGTSGYSDHDVDMNTQIQTLDINTIFLNTGRGEQF